MVNRDFIYSQVREIVVEQWGVEEDEVTPEASFEDFLIDEMDMNELRKALEAEYHIEISSEDMEKMLSVGDVIIYVCDNIRM